MRSLDLRAKRLSRSRVLVPQTVMFASELVRAFRRRPGDRPFPTRERTSFVLQALLMCSLAACGPSADVIVVSDAGLGADAGTDVLDDAGTEIPLTLLRALPSHGPFSGANTVILRGAGFRSSAIEVHFGDVAVPAADVRRIDPNRLEVIAPAAPSGTVDVRLADGVESALLEAGYTYDAFEIDPGSGPPSGGTRLTIRAASPLFDDESTVSIDGSPCTDPSPVSSTELTCRTPPHPLGRADVSIAAESDAVLEGAFAYENPFRSFGGLGGGPLEGTLTVLVRDEGQAPLEGATVVAGREGALVHRGLTGPDGTIVFTGEDLVGPITVHAWNECHHHVGFAGADAAYVTVGLRLAYLGCGEGGGGGPTGPGPLPMTLVTGEIVFYDDAEFREPTFDWTGVPEPGPGQERVAYVALASSRDLLNGDGTSASVTYPVRVVESPRGTRGFPYGGVSVSPESGAVVPFAVAGLESESGEFVPYVLGLGTPVATSTGGVEIAMDTPIQGGREIGVTPLTDLPVLGDVEFGLSEPRVAELEQLRVQARYAVPSLASGLPVFLDANGVAPENDARGGFPSVALVRQPAASGSFALAEQELFVIQTTEEAGYNWYDVPHSRTVVRVPLGTSRVEVPGFLDIPGFTAPATIGDPLPGDRALRWELDAGGITLQRVTVTPSNILASTLWYVFVHPSTRAVTLPDGAGDLPPDEYSLEVDVFDAPGIVFEALDTRVADSLAVRRSSNNATSFSVE
jgi:hypothetical protein